MLHQYHHKQIQFYLMEMQYIDLLVEMIYGMQLIMTMYNLGYKQ